MQKLSGKKKDLADIPEEIRDDLTIHTVDMIDEVLKFALEANDNEESIETPQIWAADKPTNEISANIE